MENTRKLELLTELFEMEEGELTPNTQLEELDCWESVTILSLIVMIDDECDKTISSEQIKKFKTVQDIMDIMD